MVGQAQPSLAVAKPDEAVAYILSGLLSGSVAAFMTYKREGLQQAVLVGSVVFFGITSVKMFVDIWRRP